MVNHALLLLVYLSVCPDPRRVPGWSVRVCLRIKSEPVFYRVLDLKSGRDDEYPPRRRPLARVGGSDTLPIS